MNINYQPESCPHCGTHFREYYDALQNKFEVSYADTLMEVRRKARRRGIVKSIVFGVVIASFFLALSWRPPQPWKEHMCLFFTQTPYLAAFLYTLVIVLFILVEATGKVNSHKEQLLWELFEKKNREKPYLQQVEE